jgi:ABC-type sulfate/molybdate transport systems ATPase subunit
MITGLSRPDSGYIHVNNDVWFDSEQKINLKPQILLLDEPLSALDTETRENLQFEILQAHKKYAATTLLVSHDINEISRLAKMKF